MLQMDLRQLLYLLVGLISCKLSHGIIGFDCTQKVSNLTTFSLLQVGECDLEEPKINTERMKVQLLQVNEFSSIHTRLCKVRIHRKVQKCGWLSHALTVGRGLISYLLEVTRDQCELMHIHRQMKYRDEVITNLKVNNTVSHAMTFLGWVNKEGECKNPGYWSDPYERYDGVIVTGYLEITLTEYQSTLNLKTNEIILRSGTHCKLTDIECQDSEDGYAYWNALPARSCEENKYVELYEGYVNKITEEGDEMHPTYVIESMEITFAFKSLGSISECAHRLYRTEDPKLFILEDVAYEGFKSVRKSSVENLDLVTYFNSKHVFIEKHIKGQIKRLYYDLLMHKCELERRVIANALSVAVSAPDMFAYLITKKFGHMAVVAGEVVHLMKCVQVDVIRRNDTKCYQELPVSRDGHDYFLTPRTHILKKFGTETACSALIPPMFLLGESWYVVLPQYITSVKEPAQLKPTTKRTWNYTDPTDLANSGIYSYDDIQSLRHHLMFPIEKPSVLNNIVMGVTGKATLNNGLSFAGLLDEQTLTKLADSTISKMWGKFLTFGSASAGVIGLFIIGRLIKFIADTIIHGYAIYSIYGWSIHIIGAIWNSVTQLLLHIGNQLPKDEEKEKPKQQGESEPSAPRSEVRKLETGGVGIPYNTATSTFVQQVLGETNVRANITPNYIYPDLNNIEPILKRKREDDGNN